MGRFSPRYGDNTGDNREVTSIAMHILTINAGDDEDIISLDSISSVETVRLPKQIAQATTPRVSKSLYIPPAGL